MARPIIRGSSGLRPWPTTCARCGEPLTASSVSFFNEDTCCWACLDDERQAPTYAKAKALELEHVQRGDFNFKGRGLTPADYAFLAKRLAERRAV